MAKRKSAVPKSLPLRPTLRAWSLFAAGIVVALFGELFDVAQLRWVGLTIALLPPLTLLTRLVFRPRLAVTRTVYPTTVTTDDRLRVVAEVRNRSLFGVEAGAYLDVLTGTGRAHVGGVLPAIASRLHPREGRRRRRIAYGLDRMRRGIHQVGPLLLENSDGLGLTHRLLCLGQAQQIEVFPAIHDVSKLEIPMLQTDSETDVSFGPGGEADDVTTREYRPGDALRRVHWKATARAGELRVRREERHSATAAMVVLDTSPNSADEHDNAFDLSVSVAASVLVRLQQLGFDTDVVTTHPARDAEGVEFDRVRVGASESLAPIMRRFMLVNPASEHGNSMGEQVASTFPRSGFAPLCYVGRNRNTAAAMLGGASDTSVAILVTSPGAPSGAHRDFQRVGWRVVLMDAGSRDPWSSLPGRSEVVR